MTIDHVCKPPRPRRRDEGRVWVCLGCGEAFVCGWVGILAPRRAWTRWALRSDLPFKRADRTEADR